MAQLISTLTSVSTQLNSNVNNLGWVYAEDRRIRGRVKEDPNPNPNPNPKPKPNPNPRRKLADENEDALKARHLILLN